MDNAETPAGTPADLNNRIHALELQLAECQAAAAHARAQLEVIELAVRGSNDGLWNWDLATSQVYFSPRWKSMLGYEMHELADTLDTFAQLLHPDDRDQAFAAVQAHFEGRQPTYDIEVRMLHKDGTPRWILARGDAYRDQDGTPLRMAGSHVDITERKAAEAAQRNRDARLSTIIANAPVILCALDSQGCITVFEGRGLSAIGMPPEALLGKSIFDLYQHEPYIVTHLRQVLAGAEQTWQSIIGGRHHETHAIPLRDEHGAPNGAVIVATDITERMLAEESAQRTALQEEVIRAQEAMLDELSTPLIPISNDVVVMPLIGAIDSRRAQTVLQALLHGISEQRAHLAILDITGVSVVDTQVANALIQAAQAAQLLGTQVMLTGIRPEVAQTLVGLGVDMRQVMTCSTLQSGIAQALARR